MHSGVAIASGKSRPALAVGPLIDENGTPTAFWNGAQGWRTAPTLGRGYERDVNPYGMHRPGLAKESVYLLISIHATCWLPSESVATSFHIPLLKPVFVLRLKCHSPVALSVSRNWFPLVAASVGVASMPLAEVVTLEYLIACNV